MELPRAGNSALSPRRRMLEGDCNNERGTRRLGYRVASRRALFGLFLDRVWVFAGSIGRASENQAWHGDDFLFPLTTASPDQRQAASQDMTEPGQNRPALAHKQTRNTTTTTTRRHRPTNIFQPTTGQPSGLPILWCRPMVPRSRKGALAGGWLGIGSPAVRTLLEAGT